MDRVSAIPLSGGSVRWTQVDQIPEAVRGFVLCEDFVTGLPWCKYFVHNNEHAWALLESKYCWYLSIYTVNEDGTTIGTYWAGEPSIGGKLPNICQGDHLRFTSNGAIVGGDCASQRACEKIINGQKTCVSWDTLDVAGYAMKVLPIIAAGTGVGALAKKKNRKRGALYGFIGGVAAAGILYAVGAVRPKAVCDQ